VTGAAEQHRPPLSTLKEAQSELRFPMNLIPALKQMPASDIRDWTALRAWAHGSAAPLQTDRPEP